MACSTVAGHKSWFLQPILVGENSATSRPPLTITLSMIYAKAMPLCLKGHGLCSYVRHFYAGITRIRFKRVYSQPLFNGKSAAPLTGNANTLNLVQIV